MPEVRRVGHKGADTVVPGNTPASFDAALELGVDMIEFDVLPTRFEDPAGSPLVLCHDYTHDVATATPLADGLAHLAQPAFASMHFDVDLKLPGYEDRVLTALREHDLLDRVLISTMYEESLARVRELDPSVRLGWSVPKARRDYTLHPVLRIPAAGVLVYLQRTMPRKAAAAVRDGRCDAIMAFHRLVTPRLVRAVRDAGGELYAWTVDDAVAMRRLHRMGVTGVISNDPRLFAQVMSQTAAL